MTVLIGDIKIRIPNKKKLTYEDYAKLTPPDSGNYELHNGEIIYMPTPIPRHQDISGKLHFLLYGHIFTNKLGKLYAAVRAPSVFLSHSFFHKHHR
jgi:Uma2 family endonuclease